MIRKKLQGRHFKSITEKVEVYMIVSVDQYNDTKIKYLEKQNGKDWYPRFLKDLEIALKR